MRYEWDAGKARSNLSKHGVSFADAVAVFGDDRGLTLEDERHPEERFVTVGMDGLGRILVVVYSWRGPETLRIISARRATPREREAYSEE